MLKQPQKNGIAFLLYCWRCVWGQAGDLCDLGFLSSGLGVALLMKDLLLAPGALPPQCLFFFFLAWVVRFIHCSVVACLMWMFVHNASGCSCFGTDH